ncbi:MAG: peroxiredoxin [Myxococcales bacterium]|nr:peroxiredoxin [Myxococcales bacterium]
MKAPPFSAPDQTGQARTLQGFAGRPLVLYFYPRDATPGCTKEACAFRDAWDRFEEVGAGVVGVSTDDVESHRKFASEHELPFPILADEDGKIADAYGVPTTLGFARRMTFLIDRHGIIRRVFEDVDPAVHAEEVLRAIESLGAVTGSGGR